MHASADIRFVLAVSLLLCCRFAAAAELHVPAQHATIQAAIDAATEGDTVLVAPGVYPERIVLKAGVTLRSFGSNEKGALGLKRAEATVIDGGADTMPQAGVEMAEGATLDGFTVRDVGVYDDAEWQKHFETQGEEQAYEHIGAPGVAGISATGVTCTIRGNIVHHVGYSGISILGAPGKKTEPLSLRTTSSTARRCVRLGLQTLPSGHCQVLASR